MGTLSDLEFLLAFVCAVALFSLILFVYTIDMYFERKKLEKRFLEESRKYDEWARELGAPVPSDEEKIQELRETRKKIRLWV